MTDVLTPEQRKRCMSGIRSKNTTPEQRVRKVLTALGFRYRLNVNKLPGCPDIVISRLRLAIFVHGCFWHRHSCKLGQPRPATNSDFWQKKLEENRERDKRKQAELRRLGWKVAVVWECQTMKTERLQRRLHYILRPGK
jgi:DNA mismatch endonuclease, patch repair protein